MISAAAIAAGTHGAARMEPPRKVAIICFPSACASIPLTRAASKTPARLEEPINVQEDLDGKTAQSQRQTAQVVASCQKLLQPMYPEDAA